MITTSLSIVIKRPRQQVYRFMMDVQNHGLWQAGLADISATNGMALGSVISFKSVTMGQSLTLEATVTANDGSSSFTVEGAQGPMKYCAAYSLSEAAEGTVVHVTVKVSARTAYKLAEPVLQSMYEARYEGDLHSLKALLEG